MPISEQDRSRLANWARRHKCSLKISGRGHLVELSNGNNDRAQWWPLRNRVVFNGKTKKAVMIAGQAELLALLDSIWKIAL